MAERVVIAELDIDDSALIDELQKTQKEIDDLSKSQKELSKTGNKATKQYQDQAAQLKNLNDKQRSNQRILQGLKSTQDGQIKTVGQARKAVSALSAEWSKSAQLYGEQDQRTVQLGNSLNKLTGRLKTLEGGVGNNTRNVGNYKDSIKEAISETGGLSSVLPGAAGGVKGLNLQFKKLLANPIVLIIAAIVLALKGLVKLFSRNEETMDKFNKRADQVRATIDVLSEKILKTVKALGKLLTFKFKEFGKDMKDTWKGTGDEIRAAVEAAGELADLTVQIRKEEILVTENQARRRKEIQELIFLTRQEGLAFEERRKALAKANKLELEQSREQVSLAQLKVDAAEAELANTPELLRTDEQRMKIATVRAALLDQEAQSLAKQREILNRVNELNNKAMAIDKARFELIRKETERLQKESDKAVQESFATAEAELEAFLNSAELVQDKSNQQRVMNLQNQLAVTQESLFAELELKKEFLAAQRALEIENAVQTGADIIPILDRFNDMELMLEDQKQKAKLDLVQGFFGNIATIFGENTKIGRVAAATETAINTYKSATAAYSALAGIPVVGPALGAVAAAAAVAAGSRNVKAILSSKSGLPGDSGGGGSASVNAAIPSSTGGGTFGSTNLGAGIASVNAEELSTQQQFTEQTLVKALEKSPNVLVLEDFEATASRKVNVVNQAEI